MGAKQLFRDLLAAYYCLIHGHDPVRGPGVFRGLSPSGVWLTFEHTISCSTCGKKMGRSESVER